MGKIYLLQFVFIIIEVFAGILLTVEVFGDMDPDVITASAAAIWVGLIGNAVCAVIKAVREREKK